MSSCLFTTTCPASWEGSKREWVLLSEWCLADWQSHQPLLVARQDWQAALACHSLWKASCPGLYVIAFAIETRFLLSFYFYQLLGTPKFKKFTEEPADLLGNYTDKGLQNNRRLRGKKKDALKYTVHIPPPSTTWLYAKFYKTLHKGTRGNTLRNKNQCLGSMLQISFPFLSILTHAAPTFKSHS